MWDRIKNLGISVGPVKFFAVVASIFGLAFLLITPPFQGADEIVHFYRAYQISETHLVSNKHDKQVGGSLPVSLGEVVAKTNTPDVAFYPQLKYNEHATKDALTIKNNTQVKKFYEFGASASYSPASYLMVPVGIAATRLLNLPPLVALYGGRLGNLMNWIVLMGFAIYMIPRRKWVLVAIGLLPMALFQASTLNGDAVTVGSLALFVSLILNFREKNRILLRKELILLFLVATVMVLSKEVMFLFLPLVLLLKRRTFKTTRKAYYAKATLIFLPLLCFLVWLVFSPVSNGVSAYHNGQNPGSQLAFIIHNPESYINVLWNTYFFTWGDGITRSFIGTFGWADTPLSELIVVIGYVGLAALFFATYTNRVHAWFSKKDKMLLWAVFILYWLAVSTSLYLYYSPVGFKIVYGLQGRYFLPMGVIGLLLFQSRSIRIDRSLYKRIAVYLPLFLLISSTITLYVRYFVRNV